MSTIVVVGGTGYAGAAIAQEAAQRGHAVTALSRTVPQLGEQASDVTHVSMNVTDRTALEDALAGADVIVSALSPRGELDGTIVGVEQDIADVARAQGARLLVVGGFSALRPAAGEPSALDSGDVPSEYLSEATQMVDVLTNLRAEPEGLDWVFISPAQVFGSFAPGEDLGHYRIGSDIALVDDDGNSAIGRDDFARAVVDRIDRADHHREHISVAY